jgi:hypothetical protein
MRDGQTVKVILTKGFFGGDNFFVKLSPLRSILPEKSGLKTVFLNGLTIQVSLTN